MNQAAERSSVKDRLARRLSSMEVLEGVLPTRAGHSETLAPLVDSIRSDDQKNAALRSAGYLAFVTADPGARPATNMLSGSPGLRQQTAGFADAGIVFFHASDDYWKLAAPQRLARGGNGAVTRVLVTENRILLETQRVIVRFEPGNVPARREMLHRHRMVEISSDGLPPDTLKAAVIKGNAREQSLALMDEPGVVFAEPDFIEHIGQRYTPNDPEFAKQWHHVNIQAEQAWNVTKGEGISIAVIDNGFDAAHPDLSFGPLSGWFRPTPDRVDADFVPGTAGMPDGDHGTAYAGMVAARSGNGSGGCGVAFRSSPSMIACYDQVGTQSTLARAIAYAARPGLEPAANAPGRGADIIVCSLGPNSAAWTIREVLADAIAFAASQGRDGKGCAIFWACTNGNFPIGLDEVCSQPDVMAVGRSRRDDGDDACGFGPQLEFLAPGVEVWIPTSGGGYRERTGTSFAAPCAAGVAALALSRQPGLTASELRELMRDSCDKTGDLPYIDGRNVRFGHGRVNAANAVAAAGALAPSA